MPVWRPGWVFPACPHPCADGAPRLAEEDDGAVGHVLARVVAGAFDHRDHARVADGEALARAPGAEELAAGGAIEGGVPDEDGIARVVGRRGDDDPAAAHR